MDKLKCECGHVNPEGTVLCESCGKPVEGNQHKDGNDKSKLLNMRYDGSARRSQTYNRTIVDKIWGFFSSVKNGVILIVIALLVSGLGTIFPQEMFIPAEAENRDPAIFYEEWYGIPGKIYYQLGFYELYSSWWYMILIALIGISLVICSIDRFVPLYRALKIQQPTRHQTFLTRQRFYSETSMISNQEKKTMMNNLKKQRYQLFVKDGNVLAEKNRFSRWGPYVNHIGLIIILVAALLRTTPLLFLDDYIWIREGEQKVIPSTKGQYYIENKKFHLDYYDEDDERFKEAFERTGELVVQNYQTDAVILENKKGSVVGAEPELEKITESSIRMNQPLKFGGLNGYTLYQSGYQENEFSSMTFKVYQTTDEEKTSLGKFTIDLMDVQETYILENKMELNVLQYFPDYELSNGEPRSISKFPRNPAFVMRLYSDETKNNEISFVAIGKNIDATGENEYKLGITDFDMHYVSGITVRRDYTLPFFIIGASIFMIGVIQGMYWQHRRIWIKPTENGILLAAHTNKNWFGLKKDIEKVIKGTNVQMVIDQEEEDLKDKF